MLAQCADALITIKDVEASFVIGKLDSEKIGISARSLGNINVQMIMERLGGGGHLANAATQIEEQNIEKVREDLTLAINDIVDEK